jgi:hypothetical protein
MTSASHSLAAEGGGTRPSPLGVFDDPRYAQIAVGRARRSTRTLRLSRTSASMTSSQDGARAVDIKGGDVVRFFGGLRFYRADEPA